MLGSGRLLIPAKQRGGKFQACHPGSFGLSRGQSEQLAAVILAAGLRIGAALGAGLAGPLLGASPGNLPPRAEEGWELLLTDPLGEIGQGNATVNLFPNHDRGRLGWGVREAGPRLRDPGVTPGFRGGLPATDVRGACACRGPSLSPGLPISVGWLRKVRAGGAEPRPVLGLTRALPHTVAPVALRTSPEPQLTLRKIAVGLASRAFGRFSEEMCEKPLASHSGLVKRKFLTTT